MSSTQFTFNDAKLDQSDGVWLCLHVKEHSRALRLVQNRKDKPYIAEIHEQGERRSLDANAYYWLCCGKLAKALGQTPESVYLQHIHDLGNYEVCCMKQEAYTAFDRMWKSKHLGRFTETRASKIPGCVTVLAYYGSSDFNRREMSILIDNCIQDCHALDIETLPPEKLALLVETWDKGGKP